MMIIMINIIIIIIIIINIIIIIIIINNNNVQWCYLFFRKPRTAIAEAKIIGPYFEGHPAVIKLTCSVADPGNPEAMFMWSKGGINKGQTSQGYYTISSGQLSVSDDGLWQCTPYNVIGEGQPDSINVTVYGNLVSTVCLLYNVIQIIYTVN